MFNKSQIGRSMIEMLGVLAIVGVLSVGGLAGYAKAMRTIKVNDALSYISHVRLEIKAQKVAGNIQSETFYRCSDLTEEELPAAIKRCQFQSGQFNGTYDNRLMLLFNSKDLLFDIIAKLGSTNTHLGREQDGEAINWDDIALMINVNTNASYTSAFGANLFYK